MKANLVFRQNNELTSAAVEACKALFIDPSSLFPRYPSFNTASSPLSSFKQQGISESIQRLRCNHYEARRKSTFASHRVALESDVRGYIRAERMNRSAVAPPLSCTARSWALQAAFRRRKRGSVHSVSRREDRESSRADSEYCMKEQRV